VGDEHDGLVEVALQADGLGLQFGADDRIDGLNGSSISRMLGSAARPRATPTRCCCPPESWRGYRSRGAVEADDVEEFECAPARVVLGDAVQPDTVATLSITLKWGRSPAFCST
jgi:hypothetical protein